MLAFDNSYLSANLPLFFRGQQTISDMAGDDVAQPNLAQLFDIVRAHQVSDVPGLTSPVVLGRGCVLSHHFLG